MNSKILVAGFACLSVFAVAQSNRAQDQTTKPAQSTQVTAPRDSSTGMASGRKDKKTDDIKVVPAREAGSGMATGKAAAQKDEQPAPASAPKIERVSTADVNGDGAADQATKPAPATGDPAAINNSHSNIKNAREASTGQATGKRVHNDLTIHKRSDDAPRK